MTKVNSKEMLGLIMHRNITIYGIILITNNVYTYFTLNKKKLPTLKNLNTI